MIKKIQLTRGHYALVDLADFDWLNQWNWCAYKAKNSYYAVRTKWLNGKPVNIKMHRLILGLNDSKIYADHKDGNGLNNTRKNLRAATISQNGRNRRSAKNSTSKYLGVNLSNGYYRARITANRKVYQLGTFKEEWQAALAYNEAAKEHHGEFARLNEMTKN